jgi:hypothetical protein
MIPTPPNTPLNKTAIAAIPEATNAVELINFPSMLIGIWEKPAPKTKRKSNDWAIEVMILDLFLTYANNSLFAKYQIDSHRKLPSIFT